ncbi:MAG: hypothetical protein Q9222_004079 [Ikaeria aurantiellina]
MSPQRNCFARYVATKVNKRLEQNKLRASFAEDAKLLLLPISLGSSSIALLQILDQQLKHQSNRTGRCSFRIHVLFIDQSAACEQGEYADKWQLLQEQFPSYDYSIARLEDLVDYEIPPAFDILPALPSFDERVRPTNQECLDKLLASLPSATSRADVIGILRSKVIIHIAKAEGCHSIVYGDSTTRLAERTLSETAKGRGGAIPWLTADGHSPQGIKIVYPMRDLLRKEIEAYVKMATPPITPLLMEGSSERTVSAASKHTTIEDLMSQYFTSVEQNYPSIVANVVRTSGRLVGPPFDTCEGRSCQLCGLPIADGTEGLHWDGEQTGAKEARHESPSQEISSFCYGCARSRLSS